MGNDKLDTNQQTIEFARSIQQALEFFATGDENADVKDGEEIAVVSEDFLDHGIEACPGARFRITGNFVITEGQSPVTCFHVHVSNDNSPWREIGSGVDIGKALDSAKMTLARQHASSAEFTPS